MTEIYQNIEYESINQMLDKKYGEEGTPTREVFNRQAHCFVFSQIVSKKAKNNNSSKKTAIPQMQNEP